MLRLFAWAFGRILLHVSKACKYYISYNKEERRIYKKYYMGIAQQTFQSQYFSLNRLYSSLHRIRHTLILTKIYLKHDIYVLIIKVLAKLHFWANHQNTLQILAFPVRIFPFPYSKCIEVTLLSRRQSPKYETTNIFLMPEMSL